MDQPEARPPGSLPSLKKNFPARLDRRDVYLCWKLGEEKITQWHEVYAGFAGREPIAADDDFEA